MSEQTNTPETPEAPKAEAPKAEAPKQNGKVTDKSLDGAAKAVGAQLAKQKKVRVKLYLSNEAKAKIEAETAAGKKVAWPFETVNINGYTFQIQRGKEVEVPESVYEVLSQSNII